jgi:cob(I)alamin adenosyltransferase
MVILNRIYTRTGDEGTTALVTGERLSKAHVRFEAIGTVDETNACIGLARVSTRETHLDMDLMLARIQNDLFDLGADLATPITPEPPAWEPLRVVETQVTRLETEIDALNANLLPLNSFVLPGLSFGASHLHLARTVCRRAERLTVALIDAEPEATSKIALQYLNRLSDFLFVASRVLNSNGAEDVLWVPGKNR